MTRLFIFTAITSLLVLSCSQSQKESNCEKQKKQNPKLWQLEGFAHPESIAFSKSDSCLYISNIGNNDEIADGFISKVSLNGTFIDTMWCKGLYSPKGILITNGSLYVNDLTQLKQINLETGEIIASYSKEEIGMLNDVTADEEGNIYSSDMIFSAIYMLSINGNFSKIYQNDSLHHPNGIFYQRGELFIGSWGSLDDNNPAEDSTGHFFVLDLATNELQPITSNKPGKLDGIQAKGDAFLVSAWKTGKIFYITKEGTAEEIFSSETSLGDILYMENENHIFLPLNFQNRVEAWCL